jgi:assimilatory nitrate reductase catalytic subunit
VARARITGAIRPDTVFMPFHWSGDALANAVTNDATDPISGMPEFKVCAVSVSRADPVFDEVVA